MALKIKKTFETQSLVFSFAVIAISDLFFLLDVAGDMFHVEIDVFWIDHSVVEMISVLALTISLIVIGVHLKRLIRQHRESRDSVKVASGELLAVIYNRFDEWQLTPSESEIALFLIKGLSVQEIADLRDTRSGTVKSQSSTIYQKAGVRGRNELVAYFVEDLLAGERIMSPS